MTDQPREQSRSGCGGALAWFVTVGLIRAIGQQLGWSTRAQLIAVVVTLVLVVIVMAARQQAERPDPDRPHHEGRAQAKDDPARQELLERLAGDMRQLMLIRALRDY
jgi:predicted MFS family arabinose efflux permease